MMLRSARSPTPFPSVPMRLFGARRMMPCLRLGTAADDVTLGSVVDAIAVCANAIVRGVIKDHTIEGIHSHCAIGAKVVANDNVPGGGGAANLDGPTEGADLQRSHLISSRSNQ